MNMLFVLRLLTALSVVVLLGSCATIVKEEVLMPPNVLSQAVNSMTVGTFLGSYGNRLAEQLRGRLQSEGYIDIRNSGAEATLSGNLDFSLQTNPFTNSYEVEQKDKHGKKYKTTKTKFFVTKKSTATVTYSVTQSGRTLAGSTAVAEYEKKSSGDSYSEAESNGDTNDAIVNQLIAQIVDQIVGDISPHRKTWDFELQNGDNDLVKAGVRLLQAAIVFSGPSLLDTCL